MESLPPPHALSTSRAVLAIARRIGTNVFCLKLIGAVRVRAVRTLVGFMVTLNKNCLVNAAFAKKQALNADHSIAVSMLP